jgi:hypothetical protein
MPTANYYSAPASTDDNITLIIPEKAWGIEVSQWAKVGIFDNNGTLLGSGVYDNKHLAIYLCGKNEKLLCSANYFRYCKGSLDSNFD